MSIWAGTPQRGTQYWLVRATPARYSWVTPTTRTSVTVSRKEARLTFEWKNMQTGEIVEHYSPNAPPSGNGFWRRVYTLHFGKVKGAGDSPGGFVRHVPGKETDYGPR